MSISSEIIRIKGLRTDIRTKLIDMGLLPSGSVAKLADCTEIFENMYGTTQDITTHNSYINVANKHYAKINDPNLVPSNIKSGVRIFGVRGTYSNNSPSLSYDPNNTYYYGAPGAPTEKLPNGSYDGFSSFRFDASSGSNLTANNIKEGVTIMGVQGTMGYGDLRGGYWSGGNWGQHATNEFACGLTNDRKTLTVPLLSLTTNDVLYATDFSTMDLQSGWLTASGIHTTNYENRSIVSMEFGKNLYLTNNPPFIVIDVLGYKKLHHLKANDSTYEIIYATDLANRYRAYLRINLGNSFDYVGIHPSIYSGPYSSGSEVKFWSGNFNAFQIDVRGESN